MWFTSYLHQKGLITGEQFASAVRKQLDSRPVFGKIAVKNGLLDMHQVTQVFSAQAESPTKPFGKLAVELGFLSEQDVREILAEQSESVVPLRDILVEMGVLTEKEIAREMLEARLDWGYSETPDKIAQPADRV